MRRLLRASCGRHSATRRDARTSQFGWSVRTSPGNRVCGSFLAWRRVLKPGGRARPHGAGRRALAAGCWRPMCVVRYMRWVEEGSEIGLIWRNWRSRSGQKRRWVAFQTGVRHQCFGSRCIIIPSLPRQKSHSSPPRSSSCSLCLGALWLLYITLIISTLYLISFCHSHPPPESSLSPSPPRCAETPLPTPCPMTSIAAPSPPGPPARPT